VKPEGDAASGSSRQSGALAALAACVLAASLVLALTDAHGPPCLSRVLFRLPCPACGLTRSLVALWHADLAESLRYHPLGAPLFGACVAVDGAWLWARAHTAMRASLDSAVAVVLGPRVLRGILLAVLAVWVTRLGLALAESRLVAW